MLPRACLGGVAVASLLLVALPFLSTAGAVPVASLRQDLSTNSSEAVPSAVDWRPVLPPVHNQGAVGSALAFAITDAVVGSYWASTLKQVALSPSELADCVASGFVDDFWQYIATQGLCDGYQPSSDRSCNRAHSTCSVVVKAEGVKVAANNEQALAVAVSKNPVVALLDATSLEMYAGGIMTGPCGTSLNHGMLVAGFNATGSDAAWLVRNSWGTSWGEAGYARLGWGLDAPYGECGVAMMPSFASIRLLE